MLTSNEFGKMLKEVGLLDNIDNIERLSIICEAGKPLRLFVYRYCDEEGAKGLVHKLERYKLKRD